MCAPGWPTPRPLGGVAAGLAGLDGFPPPMRPAATRARIVEHARWFAALVELTAEGFWADPGNGGNRDARSWDIIGYRHRLPDGPSGPPPRRR